MKKTLLATALAVGFAGAAAAQTSVTLYGVVDAGFGHAQFKTTNLGGASVKETRTGLFDGQQNGNRWGLRGSEDLGGGLKAVFTIESGFDIRDGTSGQGGRLFGRQLFLGLESDAWGTILFGRDYSFGAKYMPTVISPHGDIYGLNSIHQSFGASAGTVRVDNLIAYETPMFSGFQLGLGYSFQYGGAQPFDVDGGLDTDQTYLTAGLRYTNGSLTLAGNYDHLSKRDSTDGTTPLNEDTVRSWGIGASYDFGVVSLHLGFGQDKDGVITPRDRTLFAGDTDQHIDGFKANNYSVGLGIPVGGASKFMLNWQSSRLGNGTVKDTNRTLGGKNSQNIYTVAYRYDLSRRTNLYVTGGYATGFNFNNTKATEVVAGLTHFF